MTQERQNDLRSGFETAYINSNVVSNPSYKAQFISNNHKEGGELWNSRYALPFHAFFDNYRERHKIIKHQREIAKKEAVVSIEKYRLQPNTMQVGFKRVLFLVHRGQLARQTRKSYQRVFDKSVSMGLVGAGYHEYEKDYIFATVQTLNRDEHLYSIGRRRLTVL